MARARNIKPGFFKNEDLAECSAFARLCFAGMWTLADREGRLEDRPKRIKGELFAYDSVEVEPLLQELARFGFILRYRDKAGLGIIQVLEFRKHQTPHFKEGPSILASPQSLGLLPGALEQSPGLDGDSLDAKPKTSPGLEGEKSPLNEAPAAPDIRIPDTGLLIPDSGEKTPPPPPLPPPAPPTPGVAARVALVARFKAAEIHPGSTAMLDQLVAADVTWDEIEPLLPAARGSRNALAYIAAAVSGQRERAAKTVIAAKPPAPTNTNPDVAATQARLNAEAARAIAKPPAELLARRQARTAGDATQPLHDVLQPLNERAERDGETA